MAFLGLASQQWQQIGISAAIIVGTILLGRWLIRLVVHRLLPLVTRRTRSVLDDYLIGALHPPLYILAVIYAFDIGLSRIEFIPSNWGDPLDEVFYVFYLVAIFIAIARIISAFGRWYTNIIAPKTETNLDEQLLPFFRRMALIVLVMIIAIILLSHFNVDVTALVTTLGVGSLAIALAAQETLADTISGLVIIIDRPYRIGDRIEVQDLDTWGDVVDIGLRSTRIRTRDNRMVIIPNSVIGKSLIVNYSYPDTQYRIQIHVGIGYGSDIEHVRNTLIEAVEGVEGVLQDRPVEALFLEFGDSALIFRVRWWLDSYEDTRRMFDRVNTAMYIALNREGIDLPFPTREIHHRFTSQTDPIKVEQVRTKKS
jgi:small-conductance mechanosensitive channel